MSKFVDLTGKVIGNVTVLTRIETDDKRSGARWLCKCKKCNRLIITRSDTLNSSKYKECNHAVSLDIPGVGCIKEYINQGFYLVNVKDFGPAKANGKIVLSLDNIVNHCKYEKDDVK